MTPLDLLDQFYSTLHWLIICFNLFAWIIPITRKANLTLLTLTLFSWIILGIFYGIGYCPITDWQWRIKENLGETHLPNSFIKYEIDRIFRIDSNPVAVDLLTVCMFTIAFLISLYVNFCKNKQK